MKLVLCPILVRSYPILYWQMARAHSGREEPIKRALGIHIRVKSRKETRDRRAKVARAFIHRQGKEVDRTNRPKIKKENLYSALQRRHKTEE